MAAPSVTAWSIPRSRSNGTPAPEHRPDLTRASNETLVELAKMGNGAAFEKLMERHHQFCLSKALSILRNRGDAEDEVQNAFARAWTHLWQYRGGGSFGAWLTRILSNQCLMRLRERKTARMISLDKVFESTGSFRLEVIDQRALPEEEYGDCEVSRVLTREIHAVPPLLREALVMRSLRELTMQDIATHLGISVPAVKSRLLRGRTELKQRLVKHQGKRGSLLQKTARRPAAYMGAD